MKNNRLFTRFSWLIIIFWKNTTKLDLPGKNTHSLSFLKIFGNLVTQERRLKGTRIAKLLPLRSKRATFGSLFLPQVNFHLIMWKIMKYIIRTFEIFSLKLFIFIFERFLFEFKCWSPVVLSCFSAFFCLISFSDQKK